MRELQMSAAEADRRRRLLQLTNAAYAALRTDPSQWQAVQEERAVWEATLADGLEPESPEP